MRRVTKRAAERSAKVSVAFLIAAAQCMVIGLIGSWDLFLWLMAGFIVVMMIMATPAMIYAYQRDRRRERADRLKRGAR